MFLQFPRKKAITLADAVEMVENWSDTEEVIDICELPPERVDSVTDEEEIDEDDIAITMITMFVTQLVV